MKHEKELHDVAKDYENKNCSIKKEKKEMDLEKGQKLLKEYKKLKKI